MMIRSMALSTSARTVMSAFVYSRRGLGSLEDDELVSVEEECSCSMFGGGALVSRMATNASSLSSPITDASPKPLELTS